MDNQNRILIVEDDETIAIGLIRALEHANYVVTHFDNGEEAIAAMEKQSFRLVLLDIMLPGVDGLTVLQHIKEHYSNTPVILLTARQTETDQVIGLDMGADDYITKPFSLKILLARIRRKLNDSNDGEQVIRVGKIEIDLRRRILRRSGRELRLTTHEASVLDYLIKNQGRNVPREELLEKVWGYAPTMQTRTVDNQILKLRKKVEDKPSDPRHILTVHGIGYRFES